MKNKFLITIFVLLISVSGCQDFLDINHNPNATEDSTVDLVFPAGVESAASVIGGSWNPLGEIWSQHWTSDPNAPGYMGEESYNIQAGDYTYDLRGWNSLYAGAQLDFEWVRNRAEEDKNWSYYLMATTMQCYVYQVLADFFDQIPVKEALKETPPPFESGEEVYAELLRRLDVALAKDLEAETVEDPGNSDIVFGGAMDKWVQFANTLKLKILLRQRYAKPAESEEKIREMYQNGVVFLDESAQFDDFTDEIGRDNYIYGGNFRGGNMTIRASKTLLSFLQERTDPRLNFIFDAPTSGTHSGIWQGDYRNRFTKPDEQDPTFSEPRIHPLQPVYFISKAESKFMQAEVAVLGWGNGEDPGELYKAAIDADIDRLESIYSEEIADGSEPELSIIEDRGLIYNPDYGKSPFPTYGTVEEQIEAIIVQKWIAFTNRQGVEAFFEHNRTGYPRVNELNPEDEGFFDEGTPVGYTPGYFTESIESVLPRGEFPKRLLFPASEKSKNPNTPATEEINVPVWWDVD